MSDQRVEQVVKTKPKRGMVVYDPRGEGVYLLMKRFMSREMDEHMWKVLILNAETDPKLLDPGEEPEIGGTITEFREGWISQHAKEL